MSGNGHNDPPEGSRSLTFRPSVDDKDQLDAFLKDVFQKYLAQRDEVLQVSSKAKEGNESSSRSFASASAEYRSHPADGATSNALPSDFSELKMPASVQNRPLVAQAKGVTATSRLSPGSLSFAPSQSRNLPRKFSSNKSNSRAKRWFGEVEAMNVGSPHQNANLVSAKPLAYGPPQHDEPKGAPNNSPTARRKINHTFIQRQLDSIARASLLRASTIDIHAPDPEQDAPPDETPVAKRRRLERINGRRKRTKKLIEIDSLNEQLVALVDRNNRLKSENVEIRKNIDTIKGFLAGKETLAEIPPVAQIQSVAQEPSSRTSQQALRLPRHQSHQSRFYPLSAALPTIQAPVQQLPQQFQVPLQPVLPAAEAVSQHSMLASLLAGWAPAPAANQSSLLARLTTANPSVQFQNPFHLQGPAQHPQFSLPLQLQMVPGPAPQQQHFLPLQLGISHLYARIPPGIQALAPASIVAQHPQTHQFQAPASMVAQHFQGQLQVQARLNPFQTGTEGSATAPGAASRPPDARSSSPPPRNAKELKAWIQRRNEESKK
jgi:hypothetical protein